MELNPTTRRRLAPGVITMVVALVLGALVLARFCTDRQALLPLRLPVWLAFVGLLAAGLSFFTLEFRSNAFAISLTEVPVVVCVLGMQRTPMLIAATGGALVALLWNCRRSRLKLVFNTAVVLFEVAAATAVFDSLTERPVLSAGSTWLALVVGLALANAASGAAVNAVIALADEEFTAADFAMHSVFGVANAVVATTLTLLALVTLEVTKLAVLPLGFIGAISVFSIRRFAALQRRHKGLLMLHEFTAGLSSSTDLDTTLASALTEAAKVLSAGDAKIVLLRNGDELRLRLAGSAETAFEHDDQLWRAVIDERRPVCLRRGSDDLGGYLASHRLKDLMAVPLLHGNDVIGALMIADRLGDTSTFDEDDLTIFTTMANQTTVTLENLRLIDRLRDESAERTHQSLHDQLTGLPNRAQLSAAIDRHLAEGDVAVAVLDLNRFKEINDTLGHQVGDEVLVRTADRLRRAVPSSALLARLGGDEFAIMLPNIESASVALAKLASLELVFAEQMRVDGLSIRVDASIGFATSVDQGSDRAVLLRCADVAMHAAKQMRSTTVRQYDRSQERSSKRSLEIVAELRTAIDDETIDLAFQPKADLCTGAITGAESLARWTHPTLGVIRPDEFIPLAEQAGIIGALTNVVMRRSLMACATWRQLGHHLSVAVNIDAQTMLSDGFVQYVVLALRAAGLPADALTLEITERELVKELDAASQVIAELRAMGVAFSIDDFGTGYSSLSYLTRLPVDEIKIDRSFVVDAVGSPRQQAIVRAVADIAASFELQTVVEGIEDEQTWELVRSLGCNLGQGYHLARPMPQADLLRWLDDRARSRHEHLIVEPVAGT